MKKFAIFFAALVLCAALGIKAQGAGFAGESAVVNAVTPYNKSYVEIRFSTEEMRDAGVPLAFGEFLIAPAGNKINKISEKNGEKVKLAELSEKVSENFSGTISDGVLIQPARTKIFVVEPENMTVVCEKEFGEITTNVSAADGFAYFGVKNVEGFSFVCADIKNGLETVWEYKSENEVTAAALYNNLVVFGAGEKLVVHEKTQNDFAENEIGAKIKYVYAGEYAVFLSVENKTLYKLRLSEDKKIEADSLVSLLLDGELSAPAEFENKLFISSTDGFYAIDALNMEITKKYDELKNGSAPIITTGGGLRAYVVCPVEKEGKWYLYSVLDNEDELSLSEIVKIIDFTNGKIAVSESGTMYFRDAGGTFYALCIRENDIFTIVLKLVLFVATVVVLVLILRAWVKKHSGKKLT